MILDHQAHWYPPAYLDSLLDNPGFPRSSRTDDGGYLLETAPGMSWPVPPRFVDVDVQLAAMDHSGIDRALISPGAFGGDVSALPLDEGTAMMRLLNRETAGAQTRRPDRFAGLGVLPMHDTAAALEVLDDAVALGLRGISVVANVGQQSIAGPDLLPIYQAIERAGLPVFLHPAQRSVAAHVGYSPIIEMGLSWMFDTSAAALALIFSGTLDACPDLTVVHPHLGGVLPYVAERVAAQALVVPSAATAPVQEYLRTRFYTDTVGASPAALALSVATYGADRVLFGTDYPWIDHQVALDLVAGDDHAAEILDNVLPVLGDPTPTEANPG